MYIVRRAATVAFLAGLVFICIGVYDLFIESGSKERATVISIQNLAHSAPANRHLVVTGGKGLFDNAVVAYKLKGGIRVPKSEEYYIPIVGSPTNGGNQPRLLLKMSEAQVQQARTDGLDTSKVEGVRVTHWELDSEAQKLLDDAFGPDAVQDMVILDYHRMMNGIGFGLAAVAMGCLLSMGSPLGYYFLQSASRHAPRTEAEYSRGQNAQRNRRIGVFAFWTAMLITAPVFVLGIAIAIKGLMRLFGEH